MTSNPGDVSPITANPGICCNLNAAAKRNRFLRRIFNYKQMDFQYASWQMLYLFIAPQKVYRNFNYRKHTKNQWARDDPAFLILLSLCVFVSSVGYSIALRLGVVGFFKFFLYVLFVDCIGVGLVVATTLWFITNKYLIIQPPNRGDVEWGYCFDIHLNALFPLLMTLHLFQLPAINYLSMEYRLSCAIGNTLWYISVSYYIYITFLGYSCLPFVKKTRLLLYPFTITTLIFVISIALNINFDRILTSFYTYRTH